MGAKQLGPRCHTYLTGSIPSGWLSWTLSVPPSSTRWDVWKSRAMTSEENKVCTSVRRLDSSRSSWMALVAWGGDAGESGGLTLTFTSWVGESRPAVTMSGWPRNALTARVAEG